MSDFREFSERASAASARLLGWRPHEFWQATPAELSLSLGDPARGNGANVPTRDLIAQMMERDANGR